MENKIMRVWSKVTSSLVILAAVLFLVIEARDGFLSPFSFLPVIVWFLLAVPLFYYGWRYQKQNVTK